jgi:phasin family protein
LQCTIIISVNQKYLMHPKENAMFSTPEQLSAITKANVEARLAIINAFATKAFEGLGKVIDLNISTVQTSLAESAEATKQLLSVKSPQEFFSIATQTQPNLAKLLAYGRLLADISSSTQVELLKVTREQLSESKDVTPRPSVKSIPKKATSVATSSATPAPKIVTIEAKPAKKSVKAVKVAEKPAAKPSEATKVAVTDKAKASENKAKPTSTVAAKPVIEKTTKKAASAAPAQVAATIAKKAEEKSTVKPVAAAAAPAAALAKPIPASAPATPTSDKNIPQKK